MRTVGVPLDDEEYRELAEIAAKMKRSLGKQGAILIQKAIDAERREMEEKK